MTMDQTHLMDSDVFITAKNLYYAFDIYPGFWFTITGQAESSASTGFAANCSRATRRRISSGG